MTNILVWKEQLKNIYSKYEAYITPTLKFLIAFISVLLINGKLGYMSKLNSAPIVLVVALMCSFLPMNFIIIIAALFIVLHLYALSLECAVVALALFLLLFLLYFRFSPKDTIVVLLTPICFLLKIPYVIPLAMGLVGTPVSIVSVGSGIIVYYLMEHVSTNAASLNSTETNNSIQKFRFVIDGIINNKAMLVTLVAFVITMIAVYIIRRKSIDHSWTIAMIVGAIMNVMMLLVGDLIFNTKISIFGTILGMIVSVGVVKILQFFLFNMDYSRTELVQFEDDEYYYYVKAVPKITLSTPEKKVKKINAQRRPAPATIDRGNASGATRNQSSRNTVQTHNSAGQVRSAGMNQTSSNVVRQTARPTNNSGTKTIHIRPDDLD